MKVSTITLAMVLAISGTSAALAQSDGIAGASGENMTRESANFIPAKYSRHRVHRAANPNGHGINRLGVTTNPGRKYNGA